MNSIEFSRNLFDLRMEHHMTVESLAEALGVTPELVCEWECAKSRPTMEQSIRMSRIYNVSLDEIVRNPRPRNLSEEDAEDPDAAREELPEEPEMTEEFSESEELPEPERPRGKLRGWEILVILLFLLILAAAVFFLIRPDLFPLPNAEDAALSRIAFGMSRYL